MSNRSVKCYGTCDQKYPQSEMEKIGKKNYCPNCAPERRKEEADRLDLCKYVATIFNIDFPDTGLLAQIKKFREQDGYKYQGIKATLYYIIEIKKMKLTRAYGLGLVVNYYEEARAYYSEYKRKLQQTQVIKTEKVVLKMKPPVHENAYREKKLINMEELLKNGN